MRDCAPVCKGVTSDCTPRCTPERRRRPRMAPQGPKSRRTPSTPDKLYLPKTITLQLIRRIAAAPAPDREREVYDREHRLRLRHRPSGNLTLYVQLGRGHAERICDARLVVDPHSTW